jgi:hypothetical protein
MINFEQFGSKPLQVAWGQDFVLSTDATALTITAINSGTGAAGTLKNGNIRFSGAATTDNSGANAQLVLAKWVPSLAEGTYGAIEGGIILNDVIAEMAFGFAVVDTSIIASAPTDGFYIQKAATATGTYSLVVRGGSATLLSKVLPIPLGDLVLRRFGVEVIYDDFDITKATVNAYYNGNQVWSQVVTGLPSSAPTLVPTCELHSGSAVGTQTADLDYWQGRYSRAV